MGPNQDGIADTDWLIIVCIPQRRFDLSCRLPDRRLTKFASVRQFESMSASELLVVLIARAARMFPFPIADVSKLFPFREIGKWLGTKGLQECFQCFHIFPTVLASVSGVYYLASFTFSFKTLRKIWKHWKHL